MTSMLRLLLFTILISFNVHSQIIQQSDCERRITALEQELILLREQNSILEASIKANKQRIAGLTNWSKTEIDKKAKLDAIMGELKNPEDIISSESHASNDRGNTYANNGKDYGLKGRGDATFSSVIPDCNAEGTVVVEVIVDRSGKVIKATPGKGGTIADACLFEAARKTALSHKWQPDHDAPVNQTGFVVVKFGIGQ